jgi:hypothetical protein
VSERVRIVAARVMFDLALMHSLPAFEQQQQQQLLQDQEEQVTFVQILTEFLESDDDVMQAVAVQGFTKLLYTGRLHSPQVCDNSTFFDCISHT